MNSSTICLLSLSVYIPSFLVFFPFFPSYLLATTGNCKFRRGQQWILFQHRTIPVRIQSQHILSIGQTRNFTIARGIIISQPTPIPILIRLVGKWDFTPRPKLIIESCVASQTHKDTRRGDTIFTMRRRCNLIHRTCIGIDPFSRSIHGRNSGPCCRWHSITITITITPLSIRISISSSSRNTTIASGTTGKVGVVDDCFNTITRIGGCGHHIRHDVLFCRCRLISRLLLLWCCCSSFWW
mmetsp:Transcript_44762/g.50728  ORF Transcript_44762/g.50728 Transcript_44762/m.50728 type:complete len:240 (+) Transcript_44762:39-758(+)